VNSGTATNISAGETINYTGSGGVTVSRSGNSVTIDGAAAGITDILSDTSPQLGGTLDANGNFIDMGSNNITDAKVGQWDTAYGDKINTVGFNTGNGILTLNRQDGGTVTKDLDGRYPTNNGTGATGTWAISISGNAATATTAGSVPFNSISSKTGGTGTYSTTGAYSAPHVLGDKFSARSGGALVINAGESDGVDSGQTAEAVYLNAESGLTVTSSPDNWASGWAGRSTAVINNPSGDSSFPGAVSVSGVVTATGGNSTNWNTAHGWGNHAGQNYYSTAYLTGSSGQVIGGFGARTTSGSTDWNNSTNSRSGMGYTLLLGANSNGPGGASGYYHPVNFEYASKDGSGNITQLAVPYKAHDGTKLFYRSRYSGSWGGWVETYDTRDATEAATASKLAKRNSSGDLSMRYALTSYVNMSHASATRNSDSVFYSSADAYIRKNNATGFRTSLNVPTRTGGDASGTWGISITGNAATATWADTVDVNSGQSSQSSRYDVVWHSGDTVFSTPAVDIQPNTGTLRATTFSGSGSGLSSLNATNISSGTISDARLPATISSNITGSSASCTGNAGSATAIYVNNYSGTTTMRVLGSHNGIASNGNVYSTSSIYMNMNTNSVYATNFYGAFQGNATSATTATTATNVTGITRNVGDFGSISANTARGGYYGLSCNGHLVLMSDGGNHGIYDDANNDWWVRFYENAGVTLNYNGAARVESTSAGASITGALTATGNVTAYSDERLKSDIETLDGSKVYDMRGVSYTKDGEASSGVIAQELQKVAPELVHEGEEYLSVAYGNLVGYLIEAVKDLKAEVEELKRGRV
jgi:hypothetical protein